VGGLKAKAEESNPQISNVVRVCLFWFSTLCCHLFLLSNMHVFFPRKLPFSITFPIFFQINRPPSTVSRNVVKKNQTRMSEIVWTDFQKVDCDKSGIHGDQHICWISTETSDSSQGHSPFFVILKQIEEKSNHLMILKAKRSEKLNGPLSTMKQNVGKF